MSYILDALKKSEQERGHGSAPGVQTVHSSGLSYRSDKTHLWPYLLLAALFVNLAALLFFMMNRPEAGTASQQPAMPAETQPAVVAAEPATPRREPARSRLVDDPTEDTVYKPVFMPGAVRSDAVTASSAAAAGELRAAIPDVAAQATYTSVPEMDELPLEVLQHIPAMEFSAHVYSSNPVQRSIVINGRFMEEGDRFASDVYLAEITPDGAIFDFKGQLFHKRVVSAWN